jgi:hypothetical protein
MTDVGDHEALAIDLEHAPGGGYAFRLGVRAGLGGQDTARIAIAHRVNPDPHPVLKEIFACEVAGRRLEAANVHALRAKVAAALEAIAPARALPLCYFRAPAMDYELPVYEERGELSSPVVGGPKLRAHDLGGIRHSICRHLVAAGYVSEPDEVTVGVVHPRDLRCVPPAAVFRSVEDPEVWLAAVDGVSAEGPVIGVLSRALRLRGDERPRAGVGPAAAPSAPSAPDVAELLHRLRSARVGPDLYASEVRPDVWADAARRTEPTGRRLVAYLSDDDATVLELPIARTWSGQLLVALESGGIDAFLAPGEQELAAVVGRHLAAAGLLRLAAEVEPRDVPSPRAELLDPAAITSHPLAEEAW